METKLTDFSTDELHHLLVAVMTDMRSTDTTMNQQKIQALQLWRTQIVAAIGQVRTREIQTTEN